MDSMTETKIVVVFPGHAPIVCNGFGPPCIRTGDAKVTINFPGEVTYTVNGTGCPNVQVDLVTPLEAPVVESVNPTEDPPKKVPTKKLKKPTKKPVVEPVEEPVMEPIVEPVGEPLKKLIKKLMRKPTKKTKETEEEPVEETKEETKEEPVEETKDETEEPVEETKDETEEPVVESKEETEEPGEPVVESKEETKEPVVESKKMQKESRTKKQKMPSVDIVPASWEELEEPVMKKPVDIQTDVIDLLKSPGVESSRKPVNASDVRRMFDYGHIIQQNQGPSTQLIGTTTEARELLASTPNRSTLFNLLHRSRKNPGITYDTQKGSGATTATMVIDVFPRLKGTDEKNGNKYWLSRCDFQQAKQDLLHVGFDPASKTCTVVGHVSKAALEQKLKWIADICAGENDMTRWC